MKTATIVCHLGLGDLIVHSAIPEYLIKEKGYDKVYFPCKTGNERSIRSFFLLSPKVEVYVVNTDNNCPGPGAYFINDPKIEHFYTSGFNGVAMNHSVSWAEAAYQQFGLDYSIRWDYCPIQAVCDYYYDAQLDSYNIGLMHESPERGHRIDKMRDSLKGAITNEILPSITSSVLSYYPFIKYARRIDAIDSFLLHFVESVKIDKYCDLYYHKYARPLSARWNDVDVPTRYKWNVLT